MSTLTEHGCTATQAPQTIKEAAHHLLERGFMPVPVQAGTKRPSGDEWQHQRYSHPDIERVFVGQCNLGVMLGEPSSGLVDVDLDCPEAIELAPLYLPPTPAVTGRGKNPRSHWWYIAPGLATRQHRDKSNRASIVELRSTGGQTLVGPSSHPDDDTYDPLDAEPAQVPGPMLAACVQALADAVMAQRHGEGWRSMFERPTPALAPTPIIAPADPGNINERAVAYLEALPASVSGQGGHSALFTAATALVHGFGLEQNAAMAMLERHFNPRCEPRWSGRELAHKVTQAANATDHQKPRGHLRDAPRARQSVDYGVDLSAFIQGIEPSANAEAVEFEYMPFPVDLLPEPMCSFVADASHSIGCDPAFVALPLLSALGAAIGNTRRVEIKRDWLEPAIIWTGIIGESGTMKSPAITAALFATQQRQRASHREFEIRRDEWLIELEIYESKLAEWKKLAGKGKAGPDDRPEEPKSPVYERTWVDDATIEAMVARLSENPRGLLLSRDELAGWIDSMDRYSGSSGGEAAKWLEGFGGRSILVDRKTSASLYVPSAFISICGGIQPGVLRRSMDQEHRDSGMLARFLLANPPRRAKAWQPDELAKDVEEAMAQVFDHLFGLKAREDDEGDSSPISVVLSRSAKRRLIDFVNHHGLEQKRTTGDLAAAYSKLECYCPRIALIFHQIRAAVDPSVDGLLIDDESMVAAEQLVAWFTAETKRIYSWMGNDDATTDSSDRRALIKLIADRGGQVTTRELMRAKPTQYKQAPEAKAALDELVNAGHGTWEYPPTKPTGGKQVIRFTLSQ